MQSVTIQQILDWKPCEGYTPEYIEYLFEGRESLDLFDVACLNIVPLDRIWVLINLMSPIQHVQFEIECLKSSFKTIEKYLPSEAVDYKDIMKRIEEIEQLDNIEKIKAAQKEVLFMVTLVLDKNDYFRKNIPITTTFFERSLYSFSLGSDRNYRRTWHPSWCIAYDCEMISKEFAPTPPWGSLWLEMIIDYAVHILLKT